MQPHKLEYTNIAHVCSESSGDVTYYGRTIRYNREEIQPRMTLAVNDSDDSDVSDETYNCWEVPLAKIHEDLQAGVLTIL